LVVIERLDRFEAQLAEHLRETASCSRTAFDRLYEEMQAYKQNFLREAQRPLLLDLMMLYDSIDKLRRNYEQAAAPDTATLCQNLEVLQAEAEEILGRVGIERMSVTPEKLDVNLQRAVKTIPTDSPEEHLRVVGMVSAGFMSDGRPLRKEQVVVKKHTPDAPSASV
jgi:molecular chaperone GrpE (heat shock protein)